MVSIAIIWDTFKDKKRGNSMEIELYNDDCLKVMDRLIAEGVKVDAIITSPPYNMNLRIHTGKYISRWGWKNNSDSFSTKYNNYSDDLTMEDYFNFQKKKLNCIKFQKMKLSLLRKRC